MQECNEVITVFNARFDSAKDKDVYIGTIITGVSWYCSVETAVDSGLKAADKYTVRIPADADFSGKTYALPAAYNAGGDADTLFTLQNGDIVVRGAVQEENPKPAELLKGYEAFTILGVTNNCHRPRAPHWRVIGS